MIFLGVVGDLTVMTQTEEETVGLVASETGVIEVSLTFYYISSISLECVVYFNSSRKSHNTGTVCLQFLGKGLSDFFL